MILESEQLFCSEGLLIIFFPKAIFIFLNKILTNSHSTHSLSVTVTHTSAHRAVPEEEVEAGVKTPPINFIRHTYHRMLGKRNEPGLRTLKLLLQKSQLKEEEGRELPSNKSAPKLKGAWHAVPGGCTRCLQRGGRLSALHLAFLSQLAFSSDPQREERDPCLIRRDDNPHPGQ